jgi:hypothetical protein
MKSLFTITFLLTFKCLISQTLMPVASKLKTAYEKLLSDTGNNKLQERYIVAFPSDTKTFLNIFQTKNFDQLYENSYQYLELFEKCAPAFPKEVLSKCMEIDKNLIWDADAVGQLQQISVSLSVKYFTIFIAQYRTLSSKEQNGLINYYADIENYNAYSEYQDLIDKLNSVGQRDISNKLQNARTKRKKLKDH